MSRSHESYDRLLERLEGALTIAFVVFFVVLGGAGVAALAGAPSGVVGGIVAAGFLAPISVLGVRVCVLGHEALTVEPEGGWEGEPARTPWQMVALIGGAVVSGVSMAAVWVAAAAGGPWQAPLAVFAAGLLAVVFSPMFGAKPDQQAGQAA